MRTLVWSDRAMRRRDEIFDYIAERNPDAAIDLDMSFEMASSRLLDFPFMGVAGRVSGTRHLLVTPNYILVYRVINDMIEIITIRHAATTATD